MATIGGARRISALFLKTEKYSILRNRRFDCGAGALDERNEKDKNEKKNNNKAFSCGASFGTPRLFCWVIGGELCVSVQVCSRVADEIWADEDKDNKKDREKNEGIHLC